MFTAVLCSTMVFGVAAPPSVEEVWEGTLWVEFLQAKPKKKKVERHGKESPITLRLTRKNGKIRGEWIEDDRRLRIEGTMKRGKFQFRATHLLDGQHLNSDIINSTRFVGEFDDSTMQGWLYGEGNNRARGGEFELKKVDKPQIANEKPKAGK